MIAMNNTEATNFVISLRDNNEKRRMHVTNQFSKENVPFEFFDAITENEIYLADNIGIKFDNSILTLGEKGCFLSHIFLWKKIIDENIMVAGIFEDDIYLSDDAGFYLHNYKWVASDIDVIKLEKFDEKIIILTRPMSKLSVDTAIYRLKSEHLGTAGYLITNKGAKFLFDIVLKTPLKTPIDHKMFGDLLANEQYIVTQILPALCIQEFKLNNGNEKLPSVLEAGRKHRAISDVKLLQSNNKLNLQQNKLLREIHRIKNQLIRVVFNKTKKIKVKFNKI